MPRTRSASAHQKVLQAALELVAEHGVDATSMDAVARKSGVSKATIYKHWADKDALLLEMMAEINGLQGRPVFDSGDPKTDMVEVLSYRPQSYAGMRERIMPQFVAYSVSNREFGLAWRNKAMEPPMRELRHLIERAIAQGNLQPDPDFDLCLTLLLGPILYWHIFFKGKEREPRPLAEGVVDAFWRAFGVRADARKLK